MFKPLKFGLLNIFEHIAVPKLDIKARNIPSSFQSPKILTLSLYSFGHFMSIYIYQSDAELSVLWTLSAFQLCQPSRVEAKVKPNLLCFLYNLGIEIT